MSNTSYQKRGTIFNMLEEDMTGVEGGGTTVDDLMANIGRGHRGGGRGGRGGRGFRGRRFGRGGGGLFFGPDYYDYPYGYPYVLDDQDKRIITII